jgi:putative NADH-flavin reductase
MYSYVSPAANVSPGAKRGRYDEVPLLHGPEGDTYKYMSPCPLIDNHSHWH